MTLSICGACAMGSATVALFFWKFYRRTADRLLAMFSLGFATLSLHWVSLAVAQPVEDMRHYFYVLRLCAFLLFFIGIIDKNLARNR